jgi:MFS family permease
MFATGIYGTVKVIATAIFLFVGIDRFGRKKSLIAGGFWMAAMMFIIGAVLATHPPDPKATGVGKASIAMVAMIYLFVIGYSASWGPVPWVLVSEIFPTRLRAYGVGMAGMYSSTLVKRVGTNANFSQLQHNGSSTSSSPRSHHPPSTVLDGVHS